jgi:hypothetical protein
MAYSFSPAVAFLLRSIFHLFFCICHVNVSFFSRSFDKRRLAAGLTQFAQRAASKNHVTHGRETHASQNLQTRYLMGGARPV